MALSLLRGLAGPHASKKEWKAAVDAESADTVPDRTFMNWVNELLTAGEVERVRRGFYRMKPSGKCHCQRIAN